MRSLTYPAAIALLALAGCAGRAAVSDSTTTVSVVNSLSFDNAITGKRDGLRSAWPAATLGRSTEQFPMGQIKQCEPNGAACSWGVLKAQRSFGKVKVVPGGVALEVEVVAVVDRSQHAKNEDLDAALKIPADVGALHAKRLEKRELVLEYGKIARVDLGYGISYELCALRLDAARQPLDECAINYF